MTAFTKPLVHLFLIKYDMFVKNKGRTSLIGDMLISYDR